VNRHALLGLAVIVFGVAGLGVGIARVAPGASAMDVTIALAAGLLGAAIFWAALRLGRRGHAQWSRWLIVPALIGAYYLDRLSERWQLALLFLAAGYFAAFLGTIVLRVARMRG
jgi:hypothetical protein